MKSRNILAALHENFKNLPDLATQDETLMTAVLQPVSFRYVTTLTLHQTSIIMQDYGLMQVTWTLLRRFHSRSDYYFSNFSFFSYVWCFVTRWLGYFLILPFSEMQISPIEYKIGQSNLKTLANTNWNLSKWPTFFNVVVKWRNFTKSGRSVFDFVVVAIRLFGHPHFLFCCSHLSSRWNLKVKEHLRAFLISGFELGDAKQS